MKEIIDIKDREADYKWIYDEAFRTDAGLRAVLLMYDEHSDDKKSHDKILQQVDNINYRLFSATHQYLIFLRELNNAERYLQTIYQKNPEYKNAFPYGNPFFDKVELELSSVFDNIIFQVSSVFDYLGHIVSYMFFRDKSKTIYWSKLAKTARGQNNELKNEQAKTIIDLIDRRFAGRLYDYRSRLLHNIRDKHTFSGKRMVEDSAFYLHFAPSDIATKHFKRVFEDIDTEKLQITLTFLASWIIKATFSEIEAMLDVLVVEIRKDSHFHHNLFNPKEGNNTFLIVSQNPETKRIEPVSTVMWNDYKNKNRS